MKEYLVKWKVNRTRETAYHYGEETVWANSWQHARAKACLIIESKHPKIQIRDIKILYAEEN